MATTSVSIGLSTALSTQLTGAANVNVYAFAYAGATLADTASVLINGSAAGTNPVLSLDSAGFSSGKIYLVTQQAGGSIVDVSTVAGTSAVGFFTPANAQTYNFRYDLVELTLSGSPNDVGDISAINQFGAPVQLKVDYTGSSDTRSYGVSGSAIQTAVSTISGSSIQNEVFSPTSAALSGIRDLVLPGNNLVPNPINEPHAPSATPNDWTSYVSAFATAVKNGTITPEITLAFGGSSLQPKASLVDSLVKYGNFDSRGDAFWLVPNPATQDYATSNNYIRITADELSSNIYLQTAPTLEVHAGSYTGTLLTENAFTPNNAAGSTVKYFVTGFDAGFWGGTVNGSFNALDTTTTVDLDKSWNWNTSYAYNNLLYPQSTWPSLVYSNVLGSGPGTTGGDNRFYDPYAATFFQNSNAYGWSYSDFLQSTGGPVVNPQISLWDTAGSKEVSSIEITMYALGEVPAGMRSPGNPGYLGPTYATPTTQPPSPPSQNLFQFDFHFGNGGDIYAPNSDTPITFAYYDVTQAKFVQMTLPKGDWYIYDYQPGTTPSVVARPGNSGQTGLFSIYGIPAAAGGTAWYKLLFGDNDHLTTYNIYAEADATGLITNAVIDHGATAQTMVGGYKFLFADGGVMDYDIATFNAPTGPGPGPPQPAQPGPPPTPPTGATPIPPLVGTLTGGAFVQDPTPAAIKYGELAFSVNKTGSGNYLEPGHVARIDITDVLHAGWIYTPVVKQADAVGEWTTALSAQFGNGTYSVVLNQYLSSNFALDNPVDNASSAAVFTVVLDLLPLSATPDGKALQFSSLGTTTQGNWIEFGIVGSSMPNGTIVAYATDAAGHMLTRDGSGFASSLDDAALGRFGAVASDGGTPFFTGKQQVYLPVGEQLHFAVVAGNGVVDTSPAVGIVDNGHGFSVHVADGFGAIDLTATVNNALDRSAVWAGSQRSSDHPWVYLKNGTTVGVDLAWSGDYVNTLHFVRMDPNPADPTKLQVAGVDYGNSAAFFSAVQSSWEFSATQGHSTGRTTVAWTVAGGDGFYAPVLVTQPGDIWVINQSAASTANGDGAQHIRNFGANTFGFEDMHTARGADFDFNDMVLHLWLV